jgi:Tfp pilus assembly protein PilX
MPRYRTRQTGISLVIGLIMLIMLTLMVISAINSGTTNLRISGNMQVQDEARSAAQHAIEGFISSYANFYPTPTGKPATGYDINNDGTADYQVSVSTPVCKRAAQQIPPRLLSCASGAKYGLYCWDTMWEITAQADATKTGTTQKTTQGIAITFPPAFVPASVGC